jgi:hypothetical protein
VLMQIDLADGVCVTRPRARAMLRAFTHPFEMH